MTPEELRLRYGDEYPAATTVQGTRMALSGEDRFVREYREEGTQNFHMVSRFMDGSATMTAAELQREWPAWPHRDRIDFCQNCAWLKDQEDFPGMLRFIAVKADPEEWSGIAQSIAVALPSDESFPLLTGALRRMEIEQSANIIQGIALTKPPDVPAFLRDHLEVLWNASDLWKGSKFMNWMAYNTVCCIQHLIETGAPPGDFEDKVRKLAKHPCGNNRSTCRGRMRKYYDWLD
jgi:hypothetical protein